MTGPERNGLLLLGAAAGGVALLLATRKSSSTPVSQSSAGASSSTASLSAADAAAAAASSPNGPPVPADAGSVVAMISATYGVTLTPVAQTTTPATPGMVGYGACNNFDQSWIAVPGAPGWVMLMQGFVFPGGSCRYQLWLAQGETTPSGWSGFFAADPPEAAETIPGTPPCGVVPCPVS